MNGADEDSSVRVVGKDDRQAKDRKTSTELCPDQKVYTGKYRNWVYGFSIIIPAGLKGYWNSAGCAQDEKYGCVCMGDHGRFIPLSDHASMEAFVSYAMESEWSLGDYEKEEVSSLKEEQGIGQVKVLSSKSIWLGNLRARRFVIQYLEKNENIIVDRIIALHKEVEYQLIFHTLVGSYQKEKQEFEKLIASWRLTPRTG